MPNILKKWAGLRVLISTLIPIGKVTLCNGLVTGRALPVTLIGLRIPGGLLVRRSSRA